MVVLQNIPKSSTKNVWHFLSIMKHLVKMLYVCCQVHFLGVKSNLVTELCWNHAVDSVCVVAYCNLCSCLFAICQPARMCQCI